MFKKYISQDYSSETMEKILSRFSEYEKGFDLACNYIAATENNSAMTATDWKQKFLEEARRKEQS